MLFRSVESVEEFVNMVKRLDYDVDVKIGRCVFALLVTAIQGYLDQLAQEGLLEQDQNTAYIDVESTKIWLESNGKYTKAELADMSDMDIKLANIGSNVFIAVKASLLDAMEDVTITINI